MCIGWDVEVHATTQCRRYLPPHPSRLSQRHSLQQLDLAELLIGRELRGLLLMLDHSFSLQHSAETSERSMNSRCSLNSGRWE